MNIVYLLFGNNLEHYQQVYFSIYTALVHKSEDDKIVVITEQPNLFTHFHDLIETIEINKDIIVEWEGIHKFFWRVKIKALELIATKYPSQHILYMDGDTYIYNNLNLLKEELDKGQNFMHVNEGKLCELSSKTEKTMWKQMNGKTFAGIQMNTETCMWNAGLIAISNQHLASLTLCLKLNDELCAANVTRRLIEQFSFGQATNQYSKLKPADHVVGHYWGNKEQWNEVISQFLKTSFMKNLTVKEICTETQSLPLLDIPINVRRSSTQRKLKRFIDSFYKDKKAVYQNNPNKK